MNELPQQYAFHADTHERVEKGALVQSFRDETWTFEGVSRPAGGNSTGRVAVSAACPDCDHHWHRDGIDRQDFLPSVFDLYLGYEDGTKA